MGLIGNLRGPQGAAASAYPASALEVWVDYANGSDATNGLSPSAAFKTIAAAYAALKATAISRYGSGIRAVGRIVLMPGSHDVGAGVPFQNDYAVEIVGMWKARRGNYVFASEPKVVSSSSSATSFFSTDGGAGTGSITGGFTFRDFGIEINHSVNTALAQAFLFDGVDYFVVDSISADTNDHATHLNLPLVRQVETKLNSDSAWGRLSNCVVARMGLYDYPDHPGGNGNMVRIEGNVAAYNAPGSLAIISLVGAFWGGYVANNYLQGNAVAIQVGGGTRSVPKRCLFLNNTGEDNTTPSKPFYKFGSNFPEGHIIVDPGWATAGDIGTLIDFDSSATGNLAIVNGDYVGVSGYKRKIVGNAGGNLVVAMLPGGPNFTRALQCGYGVTTSRPSAAGVGRGGQWYDTTLGKPIWSTGSAWKDASGNTV